MTIREHQFIKFCSGDMAGYCTDFCAGPGVCARTQPARWSWLSHHHYSVAATRCVIFYQAQAWPCLLNALSSDITSKCYREPMAQTNARGGSLGAQTQTRQTILDGHINRQTLIDRQNNIVRQVIDKTINRQTINRHRQTSNRPVQKTKFTTGQIMLGQVRFHPLPSSLL